MNEERFYELTSKFLAREISEEEKNELSILLQIDKYKVEFENLVAGWNGSTREHKDFNTDKALNDLTDKIKEKDPSFGRGIIIKRRKIFYKPFLLRIAASILFFALILTAYHYFSRPEIKKAAVTEWRELITASGEKYELILPDKSKIVINGQSKIKYPLYFNEKKREVYLAGEAFFEISHDSLKPFIVVTGNISTVVLGTRFNVSAFPQDNNVEVSLVEGSVKVIKEKSNPDNEAIMLKPMQKLSYDVSTSISTVENFDLQATIGWKDNILKFNDTNLKDVLIKLERAFGIKFELADKSYNNFKITGNFQKATYNTICEALKRLTKLQYKIIKENNEVKKIIFYNKK
jgi:transmembrane sensor